MASILIINDIIITNILHESSQHKSLSAKSVRQKCSDFKWNLFTYSSTDNFLSLISVSDWLIFCCGNLILIQNRMSKWLKKHFLMEISKTPPRSISLHIQVVFSFERTQTAYTLQKKKKSKAKNWKKSNLFSFNFCLFLGFLLFRANSYSV